MAQTLLLETYSLQSSTPDPNNPQVGINTYERQRFTYDSLTQAVTTQVDFVDYVSYPGAPDPPAYSKPLSELVDSYPASASGPGVQQVFHDGSGGLYLPPATAPALYLSDAYPFGATTNTPSRVLASVSGGVPPYGFRVVDGPVGSVDAFAPGATVANGNVYGTAPGAHELELTDSAGGQVRRSFTMPAIAQVGCTDPRALNYDPLATSNPYPSVCEYIQLSSLPRLAAAHLPIPLLVRASPGTFGAPAIVRLLLETAPTLGGPWQVFSELRRVCDETSTAAFDLSESAKSLLRIAPPVEVGPDPALSALLRVSYQVEAQAVAGTAVPFTPAGTLEPIRVLNATLPPTEGQRLAAAPPQAAPTDGRSWESTVTYAAGIVATPAATLPISDCPARQFVWLTPSGAWASGFFSGRHVVGTDQTDALAYRGGDGAGRYARRGTVRPTLQVYSDKLDWPAYQALRGIRDSIQVYERIGPNQYVPLVLTVEAYQEYQEVTDRTYEVNFTATYPALLVQTQ